MADEVKNSLRTVIGLFMEKDPVDDNNNNNNNNNNNKQSPEGLLESLKIEGRYEEEIFAAKKAGQNDGDTTRHHSRPTLASDSAELGPSAEIGRSDCMTGLGKKVKKLFLSLDTSSFVERYR